jgi:hypothetical protein
VPPLLRELLRPRRQTLAVILAAMLVQMAMGTRHLYGAGSAPTRLTGFAGPGRPKRLAYRVAADDGASRLSLVTVGRGPDAQSHPLLPTRVVICRGVSVQWRQGRADVLYPLCGVCPVLTVLVGAVEAGADAAVEPADEVVGVVEAAAEGGLNPPD